MFGDYDGWTQQHGKAYSCNVEFEHDIDGLFKTYQNLLPMKPEDESRLWEKFRLDWNYNSNRIEGNTLTRPETRALLIDGVEPKRIRKDILQMRSHDKAIDYLLEVANADAPLTEKDIKDLNALSLHSKYMIKTITPDGNITQKEIIPGTYKTTPNIVLKTDGATHAYADPLEVAARMEATVKRINTYVEKQDIPIPDFLAELHQDFIHTHPFDDGNGRVVRLLLNYVCLKCGWPPVIIKSDKRPEYIDALERWNDGEEHTFRHLMQREIIWSLEKSIKAARGEDVEDADDVDKEIDMFMRENSVSFGELIRSTESKKNIFLGYYIPLMEILGTRLKKFETMFNSYNTALSTSILKSAVNTNVDTLQNPYQLRYELVEFRDGNLRCNIRVVLLLQFNVNTYELKCDIYSHNNQIMHSLAFEKNIYGETIDTDALEMFASKIGKRLLEIVKEYLDAA